MSELNVDRFNQDARQAVEEFHCSGYERPTLDGSVVKPDRSAEIDELEEAIEKLYGDDATESEEEKKDE